jgi:hypothetical protein
MVQPHLAISAWRLLGQQQQQLLPGRCCEWLKGMALLLLIHLVSLVSLLLLQEEVGLPLPLALALALLLQPQLRCTLESLQAEARHLPQLPVARPCRCPWRRL